jgi:hypothetical protein
VIDYVNDPEVIALKKSRSQSALNRLKERYSTLFFDLPANEKLRIQTAGTQQELQQMMDWITRQGTLVRFNVKQLIRRVEDADDDSGSRPQKPEAQAPGKRKDDKKSPKSPQSGTRGPLSGWRL